MMTLLQAQQCGFEGCACVEVLPPRGIGPLIPACWWDERDDMTPPRDGTVYVSAEF